MQPPQIGNPVLGSDVRTGNQIDLRNTDPRDVRLSNTSHFNIPINVHPRDPTRDILREIDRKFDVMNPYKNGAQMIDRDVRGDLRGISGKLSL